MMEGAFQKVLLLKSDCEQADLIEEKLSKVNSKLQIDALRLSEYTAETVSKNNYKTIVLDYRLPKQDVSAILAQLKKDRVLAPIIVPFGNDNGEILIKAVKHGATDDVVVHEKDYLTVLPQVIQKTIDQYQLDICWRNLILNSKRKLQNTFDAITDIIFQINHKSEITMANRTLANLCHTQPEKLIGRKFYEVFGQSHTAASIVSTFRTCEPINFEETINGEIYEIRSYPVFGENGKVELVTAYCKNVTEKKHLEKSLIQSEKLAAIGLLSSGIAHELRNPLNIIETARYFMSEFLPVEDQEMRDKLEIIRKNIQRASSIINNLLEFSCNSQQEREPIHLRQIIENTISLIGKQLSSHNIDFSFVSAEDYVAYFNADSIKQALLNIIINAIHAMPNGGRLTISVEPYGRDFVNVRIADTGVGIPEENLPHIFTPFFTTKEVGVGTGLGLFVTHVLIEREGGKVSVQSQVNEGTTFTLTLPRFKEK